MKVEFIPIDESNMDLIVDGSLVCYTSTIHKDWESIDHKHFGARITRAGYCPMAEGKKLLTVDGGSIPYWVKYEKLWLLREI